VQQRRRKAIRGRNHHRRGYVRALSPQRVQSWHCRKTSADQGSTVISFRKLTRGRHNGLGRVVKVCVWEDAVGSSPSYSAGTIQIASDRSRKADAKTDFFSCEAWALLAEQVKENFAKGDFVRVTGYVKLDEYEVNGEKRRTATIAARKVEKVEKTEAHAELDVQPAE
jgi:hypothetical protein